MRDMVPNGNFYGDALTDGWYAFGTVFRQCTRATAFSARPGQTNVIPHLVMGPRLTSWNGT
jgi:hypothetical protein